MSDAKHTPGEWVCDGYNVRQPRGRYIAYTGPSYTPPHEYPKSCELEDKANARLIAAAPDLLAACEAWDTGFVDGEQFDAEQFRVWVNERRAMARAAIAKAKGGAA